MTAAVRESRFRTPDARVQHFLDQSRMEAEKLERRRLPCPICDFTLGYAYGHVGIVELYCRKCKRPVLVSLAYFRRQNKGCRFLSEPQRRRYER